jgi:tRNA dimethylallyltransferase
MPPDRPIIVLAGPTASGKSAIALALAERYGATIVNADSMQVYRDLRVLTARPSAADEARAPHRLYGHVDAGEAYSVGRYLQDVAGLLRDVTGPLIFVGGTGLYLHALTNGISAVPPIPAAIRARVRDLADDRPPAELHAALAVIDPAAAASLRPSDPQRILRAIEVFEATGRSLLNWQVEAGGATIVPTHRFVLAPERAVLRARIAERCSSMIEGGAVTEAVRLAARGLDPALPAMRALGVATLVAYAEERITRAAAQTEVVTLTRQYAKRQETFFRGRMGEWPRLPPERALDDITALVESGGRTRSPANLLDPSPRRD